MSYNAIVSRIKIRPHPNADNLAIGTAMGTDVIVGKDTEDGSLGILFPDGGQLSEEFLKQNNLLYRTDRDGKIIDGYFGSKRRVRAQAFRGVKSYGFWIPISSVGYCADASKLIEGYEFCEINGKKICNKYVSQSTARALSAKENNKSQGKPGPSAVMPEHFDTKALRHKTGALPQGKIIFLTEKLHGTSGRFGFVKTKRYSDLPWYKKIVNYFSKIFPEYSEGYEYINGSRRVNFVKSLSDSFCKDGFRFAATSKIEGKLKKGETIYFEIVGWVNESATIMPSTQKLNKELKKEYGNKMTFSYGCEDGKNEVYVYRIAYTNEDGDQFDMSREQMEDRCLELGLKPVPLIDFVSSDEVGTYEKLVEICEEIILTQKHSTLDNRHVMEGICCTWYDGAKCETVKHKGFDFLLVEGIIKEDDSVEDIEESA